MSQTLVTNIFRKTGEIGRPTKMLAYRLKISFVAKSIYRLSLGTQVHLMQAHCYLFQFIVFSRIWETYWGISGQVRLRKKMFL
jgi:hypothetical protein